MFILLCCISVCTKIYFQYSILILEIISINKKLNKYPAFWLNSLDHLVFWNSGGNMQINIEEKNLGLDEYSILGYISVCVNMYLKYSLLLRETISTTKKLSKDSAFCLKIWLLNLQMFLEYVLYGRHCYR